MFIQVTKKVELRDGEELFGFIQAIDQAIDVAAAPEGVQSQAPGEPVRMWLRGIFSDHIIAKVSMTARFFKANFKRDKKTGEVKLTPWVEVKQVWVPVEAAAKSADGEPGEIIKAELGELVAKQLDAEPVQFDPESAMWAGVVDGTQGIG